MPDARELNGPAAPEIMRVPARKALGVHRRQRSRALVTGRMDSND